jgi:hypothetical protein
MHLLLKRKNVHIVREKVISNCFLAVQKRAIAATEQERSLHKTFNFFTID